MNLMLLPGTARCQENNNLQIKIRESNSLILLFLCLVYFSSFDKWNLN